MQQRDFERTKTTLTEWLACRLPSASDVEVDELQLPTDGVSNETILFRGSWNAADARRSAKLVLRVQPNTNQLFLNGDVFFQWQMMEAIARASTIPVPSLRWREEDESILGAPFYVMDHVEGVVPNGYHSPVIQALSPSERSRLYTNGLEMLARVHEVDWQNDFLFLADPGGPPGLETYLGSVERWYEWARAGRRLDHIERGLRFLREALPSSTPVSLIWGDSRPGNMLIDPESQKVASVLDWEIAALATPEVDLGWWLMFEQLFARMLAAPDGVLTRDKTLSCYEAALGRPLGDMRYYDVLAWTRMSITCVRHIDCERDTPREQMFQDQQVFLIETLRQLVEGATA